MTDVSQTFGVDTSILGLLLGANDAQEAEATANAVAQQVNPQDVVSQIDMAVQDQPIVAGIWGFFKDTFIGSP